ncbi:MAG: hypothetical protein VX938_10140, partial [Myxococcota bacterium]|nr:hypothetical protein [Myxococcota bacterium]
LNGSPAMPQVTCLALGGYSGDLSFLKTWTSLEVLKLCDSGVLTGLETLKVLPKLEVVHLRGTDTKRDMWPEALHDRLDFQGSYDKYENRFKVD